MTVEYKDTYLLGECDNNKVFFALANKLTEFHVLATLPYLEVVPLVIMSWAVSPSGKSYFGSQSAQRDQTDY